MTYDFDEIIDRANTNCMNIEAYKAYIFKDPNIQFPYRDEEFIRMWLADMEFATPEFVRDAIKARVDRKIFGYTKDYTDEHYNAFVSWCRRHYDWSFPRSEMVHAPGVIRALFELVEYLCQPDEKVLFFTPSYGYFQKAADYNGREAVYCDLVNNEGYYTIDFADFEAKARDPKARLCIFCNPHNPSGRMWTEAELKRLADICWENNIYIVSDEIHCDLVRTGRRHLPLAKVCPDYDHIITCMAPSKTFNLAGLMFANVIIPNAQVRESWSNRHYGNENPLSLAAATAAYTDGDDWLAALKLYLDANFALVGDYLQDQLPQAKYRIPEATYLGWVDISAYIGSDVFLPLFFARNAGVLLEGGNMFVANSDSHIRLNAACPRSMLQEGLRRICQALNNNT